MKLSESITSEASVEQTFEAHCEPGVREAACKKSGALSWNVTIEPAADGTVRIQVDRSLPPDVPDFAKKFIGDKIEVRQIEQWSAADSAGGRTADLRLTIKGQPVTMVGTAVIAPSGSGSTVTIEGDVKVAVPIIGKKFEPDLARVIASGFRTELQTGQEWLESRS
ncbi:DUF2505 domain-containing protein [Jatrophihabitans sp. DSM 45814]